MSRIGFQFNAEDEENMFEVFDKYVYERKNIQEKDMARDDRLKKEKGD